MINVIETIGCKMGIFDSFSEVYIFGSVLLTNTPNDVDILLVYEREINRIGLEKGKISDFFAFTIGIDGHLVTLSKNEMEQTKFLDYVAYERIK